MDQEVTKSIDTLKREIMSTKAKMRENEQKLKYSK